MKMRIKSQTSTRISLPDKAKEKRRTSPTDASNGMVFFNTNIRGHGRHRFDQMALFVYQHLVVFFHEIHAYSGISMVFSVSFSMFAISLLE